MSKIKNSLGWTKKDIKKHTIINPNKKYIQVYNPMMDLVIQMYNYKRPMNAYDEKYWMRGKPITTIDDLKSQIHSIEVLKQIDREKHYHWRYYTIHGRSDATIRIDTDRLRAAQVLKILGRCLREWKDEIENGKRQK